MSEIESPDSSHTGNCLQSFILDPLATINNKVTCLQEFLVSLMLPLPNYKKKCFLGTTWAVMLSADLNLQRYIAVLPVAKGLKLFPFSCHDLTMTPKALETRKAVDRDSTRNTKSGYTR